MGVGWGCGGVGVGGQTPVTFGRESLVSLQDEGCTGFPRGPSWRTELVPLLTLISLWPPGNLWEWTGMPGPVEEASSPQRKGERMQGDRSLEQRAANVNMRTSAHLRGFGPF